MTVANSTLDEKQLYSLLRELVVQFPNEKVIIRGDKNVDLQHVITAMDTASLAGIKDIRLSAIRAPAE